MVNSEWIPSVRRAVASSELTVGDFEEKLTFPFDLVSAAYFLKLGGNVLRVIGS